MDFPAPPFGDATVTMGIFLTRFVRKPDLALHQVPVNIGSIMRPDNWDNLVLVLTGSYGLSGLDNDRVLTLTGCANLSACVAHQIIRLIWIYGNIR